MKASAAQTGKSHKFSLVRVLIMLVPLVVVLAAVTIYKLYAPVDLAINDGRRALQNQIGLRQPITNKLADEYTDADGDLVADAPQEASKRLDPETIVFSYIAEEDPDAQAETWKALTTAMSEKLGRPVEYFKTASGEEQLRALRSGKLHVTGLNTGATPRAVNVCGFVPVAVLGNQDDIAGYKMLIITPNNSGMKKLSDIKGKSFVFTDPLSNSGCKAAVVTLRDNELLPGSDYDVLFSMSHENSIRGIVDGDYEVAAVASDLFERFTQGEDKIASADDFDILYESPTFPPAVIGYAHNLDPKLAEQIREFLLSYEWDDNLKSRFPNSNTTFVPINYKDAFEAVRRIDDVMGLVHELEDADLEPAATTEVEEGVDDSVNEEADSADAS